MHPCEYENPGGCDDNYDPCCDSAYPAVAISDSESFHAVEMAGGNNEAVLAWTQAGGGVAGAPSGLAPGEFPAPLRGRLAQLTVWSDLAPGEAMTILLFVNNALQKSIAVPAGPGPHVIDVTNMGSNFARGARRQLRVAHSLTVAVVVQVSARWTFLLP